MFKTRISSIKTIRQGDDDFMLNDGMITSPRAGFEISQRCPDNYRSLLLECIKHGWIKPVAHLHDHEYMWDKLKG